MLNTHLIARQPIYNSALKVIGFELLYRANDGKNSATIIDKDSATIDVLLAAYNDLSIQEVVGNDLAFINFTSNIILHKLPLQLPKRVVIEVLEDQPVTPELIKTLKNLRKQGYKIALDDFCLNQKTLSLIECADIIKLDVLDCPPESWAEYMPNLLERGISMLAEKVETHEVYEQCKELGFELFQGYFFSKPKILSGKKMSRNETSVLKLINKINNPEVEYDEVITLISTDVSLSYNLLRTVNSGMYSLSTKVDSIRQAAITLGLNHLRNWVNLLALGSLDNKPSILIESAMIRAKMCETIGEKISGKQASANFFTVGLFSIIDAFFDAPLDSILAKLHLNTEVFEALTEHKGVMGYTLETVIFLQEGKLDNISFNELEPYDINVEALNQYYIDSTIWAKAFIQN